MRKLKTIKIDDREITVKELRVKDIMGLFAGDDGQDLIARLETYLPRCIDGLTVQDLQDMAPSEIKAVWEAFREINAVFFGVAQEMGLSGAVEEIKQSIRREFSAALAGSLKPGTAMSGTTAIAGSSLP